MPASVSVRVETLNPKHVYLAALRKLNVHAIPVSFAVDSRHFAAQCAPASFLESTAATSGDRASGAWGVFTVISA